MRLVFCVAFGCFACAVLSFSLFTGSRSVLVLFVWPWSRAAVSLYFPFVWRLAAVMVLALCALLAGGFVSPKFWSAFGIGFSRPAWRWFWSFAFCIGFGRVRWSRAISPFVRRLVLARPGDKVANSPCIPSMLKYRPAYTSRGKRPTGRSRPNDPL